MYHWIKLIFKISSLLIIFLDKNFLVQCTFSVTNIVISCSTLSKRNICLQKNNTFYNCNNITEVKFHFKLYFLPFIFIYKDIYESVSFLHQICISSLFRKCITPAFFISFILKVSTNFNCISCINYFFHVKHSWIWKYE